MIIDLSNTDTSNPEAIRGKLIGAGVPVHIIDSGVAEASYSLTTKQMHITWEEQYEHPN